jgi:hypothetical protein
MKVAHGGIKVFKHNSSNAGLFHKYHGVLQYKVYILEFGDVRYI